MSRGFALPMVILLSLVVGLSVATMLSRQSNQERAAMHSIETYQLEHAARGMRELADGWRESISLDTLTEFVIDGPREAIRVSLADGSFVTLVADLSQGTLGVAPVSDLEAQAALDFIVEELQETAEQVRGARSLRDQQELWMRVAGPTQAFVLSTPEPVLEAIARAVASVPLTVPGGEEHNPDAAPEDLTLNAVQDLIDASAEPESRGFFEPIEVDEAGAALLLAELDRIRRGGRRDDVLGDDGVLRTAAIDAGLGGQRAALLQKLLTTAPGMFEARVELWNAGSDPRRDRPAERFIGLFSLGGGNSGLLSARSGFYTWNDRTPPPASSGLIDEWAIADSLRQRVYAR